MGLQEGSRASLKLGQAKNLCQGLTESLKDEVVLYRIPRIFLYFIWNHLIYSCPSTYHSVKLLKLEGAFHLIKMNSNSKIGA